MNKNYPGHLVCENFTAMASKLKICEHNNWPPHHKSVVSPCYPSQNKCKEESWKKLCNGLVKEY